MLDGATGEAQNPCTLGITVVGDIRRELLQSPDVLLCHAFQLGIESPFHKYRRAADIPGQTVSSSSMDQACGLPANKAFVSVQVFRNSSEFR